MIKFGLEVLRYASGQTAIQTYKKTRSSQYPVPLQRDGAASLGMWHVRTLNRISIRSFGRRSDRPVIAGDLVDGLVPAG